MGKLHRTYDLTITTLSPLHIGTGNTLMRGYDYVVRNGRTWVVDTDHLAEFLYNKGTAYFDKMVSGEYAHKLLTASDFKPDSPLFRYVIQQSGDIPSELREMIKNPWDQPYIPGSSLKGAFRTAIASVGWQLSKRQLDSSYLSDNPGADLEKDILFGAGKETTAHYDVLRCMQISDTESLAPDCLQVQPVKVLSGDKHKPFTVYLETVKTGTAFKGSLAFDGFLGRDEISSELGWSKSQRQWLEGVAKVANHFTQNRLRHERLRWKNKNPERFPIGKFYRKLDQYMQEEMPSDEFILQLGWGGGWDSKTLGIVLQQDEELFSSLVSGYDLLHHGRYNPSWPVPKSRRVIMDSDGKSTALPLGWISVKMAERVK